MATAHDERVERTIESIPVSAPRRKWEEVDGDKYNADHIIHAYKRGQERGVSDTLKAVSKVAEQNLYECMNIVDELVDILKSDLNIDFKDARIKMNSFDDFEALILLDRDDYFSDKIDEVYELYYDQEKDFRNEFDFHLIFSFLDDHINYEKITMDGYRYIRQSS